jgi:hypothetical protein
MTPTKTTILHGLLDEAGQVAERYYAALDALDMRQREFCEAVGPALKAASQLTGTHIRDLSAVTDVHPSMWTKIFNGRSTLHRREYINAVRLLTGELQPPVGSAGPADRTQFISNLQS